MGHGFVPGPIGIFVNIQNRAMPKSVDPGVNTDFLWSDYASYQQWLEPWTLLYVQRPWENLVEITGFFFAHFENKPLTQHQ